MFPDDVSYPGRVADTKGAVAGECTRGFAGNAQPIGLTRCRPGCRRNGAGAPGAGWGLPGREAERERGRADDRPLGPRADSFGDRLVGEQRDARLELGLLPQAAALDHLSVWTDHRAVAGGRGVDDRTVELNRPDPGHRELLSALLRDRALAFKRRVIALHRQHVRPRRDLRADQVVEGDLVADDVAELDLADIEDHGLMAWGEVGRQQRGQRRDLADQAPEWEELTERHQLPF